MCQVNQRKFDMMLRARTVDLPFLRVIEARSFHGRVHSVFDKAINIEHATGELFTLASRDLDNAPNTAVLDIAGFGATGITIDDRVGCGEKTLWVGGAITVQLAAAASWECRLPRYAGASGRLQRLLPLARTQLARHGRAGGMLARRGDDGLFTFEAGAALAHRTTKLLEALAQGRHESARDHATSMVGLGPGLTPSGDDFLVGLFAVLNIVGSPCHGWLNGGTDIVDRARELTHPISLAALTHAALGRVRESTATLIEFLMGGTPETIVEPLRRVLAIGSTSGTDMVAGILSGLELNLHVGGGP